MLRHAEGAAEWRGPTPQVDDEEEENEGNNTSSYGFHLDNKKNTDSDIMVTWHVLVTRKYLV